MSKLPQAILKIIASRYPLGNKALYNYLYSPNHQISRNSLSVALSRMKEKGLLKIDQGKWIITPEGKKLLKTNDSQTRHFISAKKLPKNTIIVFDIPENRRRHRDWLRSELINLDFELIQKSVWFGPPLPEEFVEYLYDINLLKYVRFFRASERDLI